MRAPLLILAIASWSHVQGQVYFEGLYGDDASAGGVGTDGTAHLSTTYLIWAGKYGQQQFRLHSFIVGVDGELHGELDIETPDSLSEQAGNVIIVNDTICIGMSYQKALTQPAQTRGDMVLTCFHPDGQVYWRQVYGLPDRIETPLRVVQCSDGGYAITGQVDVGTPEDGNGMVYLVRTDGSGTQLWGQTYGGTLYDSGSDLIQTPDGGFFLLGWTRSFGAGQRDFYLVKTDSLGNQQWQRTFGTAGSEGGRSILLLNDGNYLLTGSGSEGLSSTIGRKYKVNPEGGVIWSKTYAYQNNNDNNLHRTVQLPNGDLVSAGLTDRNSNNNSGWLLKTDSQGNVIWQREFDKNQFTDLFYSVLLAEDGGFLLSGQAWNEETNSQDAWLLKVDSVGCPYPNCLVGMDELGTTLAVADVWPNPATDFVNVEFLQSGMAEIQLYDMAGKLLLQRQAYQSREAVDVSTLQNGVYLLTVIQASSRTTVRIVVQH